MAIAFNAITIRHERRIRLSFTASLGSGAFTSVAYYTVTSLNGAAASPSVARAFAVGNSPNVVELQLAADLVQGAAYRVSAVGVPAADASTTPDPSDVDVRFARETSGAASGARGPVSAIEEILFGRDARWTGSDFAEAPGGDLDEVSGLECVETDLSARMLSNGLPWDGTFGLGAREYVDGAPSALPELRGRAIAQMRADDRVASADAVVDLSDPTTPILEAQPVLVGGSLVRGEAALQLRQVI